VATSCKPKGIIMNLENAFSDYVKWMLQNRKSPLSAKSYAETFNQFSRAGYGIVEDTAVESFLQAFPTLSTRNKKIAHLRAFSSWVNRKPSLREAGLVKDFTFQQTKLPVSLPVIVSQEVLDPFLERLEDENPFVWAHAVLLKYTGLRFTEAWSLREGHLCYPSPGVACIKFRGKRQNERIVVLNKEGLAAFKIWTKQNAFVSPAVIRTTWKRLQEGSEAFVPHVVRHTTASNMRASGASYDQIADLLGNSVSVCRERYSRVDINGMKDIMDKL